MRDWDRLQPHQSTLILKRYFTRNRIRTLKTLAGPATQIETASKTVLGPINQHENVFDFVL